MNNIFPIDVPLTIVWHLTKPDGTDFSLEGYSYRLFYKNGKGKAEADSTMVTASANAISFVFPTNAPRFAGEYSLQLLLFQNSSLFCTLNYNNAFGFTRLGVPGQSVQNQESTGRVVHLYTVAEYYLLAPVVPTVGSDGYWYVNGVKITDGSGEYIPSSHTVEYDSETKHIIIDRGRVDSHGESIEQTITDVADAYTDFEERFSENEGSAAESVAGDGSRWGTFKAAEEVRAAAEGTPEDEAGADTRWGAEKARRAAETARLAAEGTSSDEAGADTRWGAEKARRAAETERLAAEGTSSDDPTADTRWGAYKRSLAATIRANAAAAAAEHMVDINRGPKGEQGNTGSSVDYPYELVNNVTTDDATKGLSAAQGVVLDGKISQLGQEIRATWHITGSYKGNIVTIQKLYKMSEGEWKNWDINQTFNMAQGSAATNYLIFDGSAALLTSGAPTTIGKDVLLVWDRAVGTFIGGVLFDDYQAVFDLSHVGSWFFTGDCGNGFVTIETLYFLTGGGEWKQWAINQTFAVEPTAVNNYLVFDGTTVSMTSVRAHIYGKDLLLVWEKGIATFFSGLLFNAYITKRNNKLNGQWYFTGSVTDTSIAIENLYVFKDGAWTTPVAVNQTFDMTTGGSAQTYLLFNGTSVTLAIATSQVTTQDVLLVWDRENGTYIGGLLFDCVMAYFRSDIRPIQRELKINSSNAYPGDIVFVPFVTGAIKANDGTEAVVTTWAKSDFVEIPDGVTQIIYSKILTKQNATPYGMALYDNSKNFIADSGVTGKVNPYGSYFSSELNAVDIPDGAKYVRFTYYLPADSQTHGFSEFFCSFVKERGSRRTIIDRIDDLEAKTHISFDEGLGLHVEALSQGHINVVKRARQMTDILWTPAVDLPRLEMATLTPPDDPDLDEFYGNVFKAGKTYRGLPYGRCVSYKPGYGYANTYVGHTIPFETFITSVRNKNSMLCKESIFNLADHRSTAYACVCSSLVTYAIAVANRLTQYIPGIPGMTNRGKVVNEGVRFDLNTLRLGDILNSQGYHTAVVTDIIKSDGNVVFVEISEATPAGNGNRDIEGNEQGGVCRRVAFDVEQFFWYFEKYNVLRYSNIWDVPYIKNAFVKVGNECDSLRLMDYSVMPYEGNQFAYLSQNTSSVKLIISCDNYSYLRVFKDNVEIAGSPFAITASDTEKVITEVSVGEYSAYLCDMSDGANTAMTGRCNWSIVSD